MNWWWDACQLSLSRQKPVLIPMFTTVSLTGKRDVKRACVCDGVLLYLWRLKVIMRTKRTREILQSEDVLLIITFFKVWDMFEMCSSEGKRLGFKLLWSSVLRGSCFICSTSKVWTNEISDRKGGAGLFDGQSAWTGMSQFYWVESLFAFESWYDWAGTIFRYMMKTFLHFCHCIMWLILSLEKIAIGEKIFFIELDVRFITVRYVVDVWFGLKLVGWNSLW